MLDGRWLCTADATAESGAARIVPGVRGARTSAAPHPDAGSAHAGGGGVAHPWKEVSPFALAVAAGTFLHIAEVDLIPTVIAEGRSRKRRTATVLVFLAGVAVVAAATLW